MIGSHRLILIAAVDQNWAIGRDNKLLWHIPTDMKRFKKLTENNIVVYGYNTLLSFPHRKILPNRDNIILTSKIIACGSDRMQVAHSIQDVLNIIESFQDKRDVFICGGASVYKQFIDMCDLAYITHIDAVAEGADAFIPKLYSVEWKLIDYSPGIHDSQSNLTIRYHTFAKKKKYKYK